MDLGVRAMRGLCWLAVTVALSACLTPVRETPLGMADAGSSDGGVGGGSGGGGGGGLGGGGGGDAGADGGLPDAGLVPLTCTPGTWCWLNPAPQGQSLHAVFAVSATEAWAVGDRGATLRLQDGTWTAMTPVTDRTLRHLWGSGANDVWAIGYTFRGQDTDHQLLHFDGTQWAVVAHGARPVVLDITGSASGEAWLLTGGTTTTVENELQRWNGSAFVPAPALPTGLEPMSVCVRSANEAWATVRDDNSSWPIALYLWDGTAWSLVRRLPAGSSQRFDSRVMCPADGVAVAQVFEFDTGTYSFLEVRNGQVSSSPAPRGSTLVRTPHGDVFSVNGFSASRWAPTGWQPAFTLASGQSVYSVEFDFVADTGWLADLTPVPSSWNGSAFVPVQRLPSLLQTFVSPPGANPQDPIAVFGEGSWARQTGTGWLFASTPTLSTGEALRVWGAFNLPGGDAWLVGNAIARYDATAQTITPVVTPTSGFGAIDGSDATTLWAVGDLGKVLRFDGQQWAAPAVAPPLVADGFPNLAFTAVDVRSANDVMLLGNDPAGGAFASVFYRWDGATWSFTLSFGGTLTMFDRDTQGNVYVVEGGTVQKRGPSASTWTTVGVVSGSITRLRVYGPDDIELVVRSEAGLGLYRWDSDQQRFTLEHEVLGFDGARDIVPGAPVGGRATYWSAGSFGALLRYEPAN